MKVNNIVLFALLIMLSNVSFAKKLDQGEPIFQSIGANQPTPGQEYYISSKSGKNFLTNDNTYNLFSNQRKFDRSKKRQQTWVFEKNDDGSFSIRNANGKYLQASNPGGYSLLPRNQNESGQKFIYENRSIKSRKTNLCLRIKSRSSTKTEPILEKCPRPVDIKKLLN